MHRNFAAFPLSSERLPHNILPPVVSKCSSHLFFTILPPAIYLSSKQNAASPHIGEQECIGMFRVKWSSRDAGCLAFRRDLPQRSAPLTDEASFSLNDRALPKHRVWLRFCA